MRELPVLDSAYGFFSLEVSDLPEAAAVVDRLLLWVLESSDSGWEANDLMVERLDDGARFELGSDLLRLKDFALNRDDLVFALIVFREYLRELGAGKRALGLRRGHADAIASSHAEPTDVFAEVDRLLEEPPTMMKEGYLRSRCT